MGDIIVGRMQAKDGREANVVYSEGMMGYRFDAVGIMSLPYAVALAVAQTQGKLDLSGILVEKGKVIFHGDKWYWKREVYQSQNEAVNRASELADDPRHQGVLAMQIKGEWGIYEELYGYRLPRGFKEIRGND